MQCRVKAKRWWASNTDFFVPCAQRFLQMFKTFRSFYVMFTVHQCLHNLHTLHFICLELLSPKQISFRTLMLSYKKDTWSFTIYIRCIFKRRSFLHDFQNSDPDTVSKRNGHWPSPSLIHKPPGHKSCIFRFPASQALRAEALNFHLDIF